MDLKTPQPFISQTAALNPGLMTVEMFMDVHEDVGIGIASGGQVEGRVGSARFFQERFQCGRPFYLRKRQIRLRHL
jgi:hypothetical protein